ncbi:MAG: alpha/beta hydrolase [Acidimicrobiales bacterium]
MATGHLGEPEAGTGGEPEAGTNGRAGDRPGDQGGTKPEGVEPATLVAPDGTLLEAELTAPANCSAAAVLAHPHPLQGGSMRSIVTSALFAGLPATGVACLRFNFRGVGGSAGSHDRGDAERLDVVAAIDALAPVTEGLPLGLVGWSFGADTVLCVADERVAGWAAIAPPVRQPPSRLAAAHDPRPKLLVVPERDQFRPPPALRQATDGWASTVIEVVGGADHFLTGRLQVAVDLVASFLASLATSNGSPRGSRRER